MPTALPLAISEQIAFRKIRGDDLSIITEKDEDSSSFIKGGTFTLTVDPFDPKEEEEVFRDKISSSIFAINVLGRGNPISVDRVYVTRHLRKTSLNSTKLIGGHRHPNLDAFEISKGTDLSAAPALFTAVCTALRKHPPLRITLSRFNSAMGRLAWDDKLIDLCISLESIFQAQTEISFQFALFNSLLSEDDFNKRLEIFKTLKKLYDQRSNVVHGNKELDQTWIAEKWEDLTQIARAAILKKVDFLTRNDHNQWKLELQSLALGAHANGAESE